MKKLTLIFAALVVLLMLCSCGGPELGDEATIEVNTLDGVNMEVAEGYTSRAATVIVTNETKTHYISDILFAIQKEVDGRWYGLVNEFHGDNIADLYAYRPKSSNEIFCSWDYKYGALNKGHYRIVYVLFEEDLGFDGEPYYLAAEFYIE